MEQEKTNLYTELSAIHDRAMGLEADCLLGNYRSADFINKLKARSLKEIDGVIRYFSAIKARIEALHGEEDE